MYKGIFDHKPLLVTKYRGQLVLAASLLLRMWPQPVVVVYEKGPDHVVSLALETTPTPGFISGHD